MSAAGLAARRAAAALVEGVLEAGRPLDEGGTLDRLDPPDRARARRLATETLRHLARIDAVLAPYLRKPPPGRALTALRLACLELLSEGVPPHAAVDAAVRLAQGDPRGRHAAGMVNAVARRLATGGRAAWDAAPPAPLPAWIAEPVAARWGEAAAAAIAAAHSRTPPLDLTPRDPAAAPALTDALGAELLPTGSLRLAGSPRISGLPGYDEGAWWVQDAAAALPARLFGPLAGLRALDLCAAPGGKTLQLAAAGAEVTALDISAPRLERLSENLARTGLAARIVAADARDWTPEAPFDAVLLDAPCSATGTLRRHPDLPYLRDEGSLASLVPLQDALLARAYRWLRPGGRLVFATCSLLPEEGEARVTAFLAANPEASVTPPDAAALGVEAGWIDAEGGLRLRPDHWPERGGMDGFYAALIVKRT